jgi:hypothetical protein
MKKLIITNILATAILFAGHAQKTKVPSSDLLTNWMIFHSKMVRNATGIAHVAYSRHFAYSAIAAYESIVQSDASYRSLKEQLDGLVDLPSLPKGKLFYPASLNAAYASMLRNFYSSFGSCKAAIDSMESLQLGNFARQHVNKKTIENGVNYGKTVADAIIRWSETDNSSSNKQYTPLKGEGLWAPSTAAAAPFWCENRTFTHDLLSFASFKQPVYSRDTASDFYKMAKEVYTTSLQLSPEQKATALYWDDSPNGQYLTVFGHWASIAAGLIRQHQCSLLKGAEAYAKMAIAMSEASVVAWKAKYQYNVLRPVTYIQRNIDQNWASLISTPPHPEFPAAHATLSNAAATALSSVFGEACNVTDNSYVDIGMKERSYPSLQQMAEEAGYSRLYGGIHYRYSIEQGFSIGAGAAKYVIHTIHFH